MRVNISNPYVAKLFELFAWLTLILAFVIGYIADSPDYLPLVKKQYPGYQWGSTDVYPDLPIVFVPSPDNINEALVIVEGTGYGGPFILGVRAIRTDESARIQEVVILSHKETPSYIQKMIRKNFFYQFINKPLTNDFLYGQDVDAVSGATISAQGFTSATAQALHKGAIEHLKLEKTWKDKEYEWGSDEFLMLGLFAAVLLIVYGPKKIAKPFKVVLPFATLAFVGFYVNASISLGTLAGIVMGYVPGFSQYPIWWILVGGTIAGILLLGKNFYCGYMCPFDVVQGLLQKISGIKLAIKPSLMKSARRVILTMSWLALLLIFLSRHPALGSYEPFSMMFSLEGMGIQWYILPISLFGAFLVPQFWCRLFCPVGLTLSEAVRLRRSAVNRVKVVFTSDKTKLQGPVIQSRQGVETLTVLYASQTGNSRQVAHRLGAAMTGNGLSANLYSMADYPVNKLADERHLLIVTSTYGEGQPPEDAEMLHRYIHSEQAPRLSDLKYGVLGLGDSGYLYFCETALDFDTRLQELGARRIIERVDCDTDYEDAAEDWIGEAVDTMQDYIEANCSSTILPIFDVDTEDGRVFHKHNPFSAKLLINRNLTGEDSVKDIHHLAISLEGSEIKYQPGDLLGIWFENNPQEVDELLNLLSIKPNTTVQLDGKSMPIRQALVEKFELTQSQPKFVERYTALVGIGSLNKIADDKDALRAFTSERQIYDIVREYPARVTADSLISCLRKLTPRKYSIASCQETVGNEVHVTVALVNYRAFGHPHYGGASGYLTRRVPVDTSIRIFTEINQNFRLPTDTQAPIIMIGPGTGISPFRAFMQQRKTLQQSGDNWLIFGNPHRESDFLYEEEWLAYQSDGLLTRMDLAFSRDQAEKVYVQHRILENDKEFFDWLERGAYVYVCGDATHMEQDVQAAILQVIQERGNKSLVQAEAYLDQLKQKKRYQKDVY